MRKFKFRAWTGAVMFDYDSNEGFWAHAENHSEWPVMQYTGLKDKNGKEIYEGDILKSNRGIIGPVEWDEYDTYFVWTHPEMINIRMSEAEIVGNIYEQADLLPPVNNT